MIIFWVVCGFAAFEGEERGGYFATGSSLD